MMGNANASYSAPPASMMATGYGYPPPPLDEGESVILQEALQSQLAVEDKREIACGQEGRLGRNVWAALGGMHTAERIRTYRVRASDGFTWTYTQPYSGFAQMPGEHSFILRGAFAQPVQVLPASNQWRRPRFWLGIGSLTFLLLFAYGLGLLVPPLMILLYRPWVKWISPDPSLAKWLSSQPFVKGSVSTTKFGWVGLLGARGWKLPWVMQLHSVGDGTSRLVVKSPDVGRVGVQHWRVGFAQAQAIARAIQGALPPGSFAPAQRPMQQPFSAL